MQRGVAGTKAERTYYILRGGDVLGPLTTRQLSHVISTGQIAATCGVSRKPEGPFRVIASVPQLAALVPSEPPPKSEVAGSSPPNESNARTDCVSEQTTPSNPGEANQDTRLNSNASSGEAGTIDSTATMPGTLEGSERESLAASKDASVTAPPLPSLELKQDSAKVIFTENTESEIVDAKLVEHIDPSATDSSTTPLNAGSLASRFRNSALEQSRRLYSKGRQLTGNIYSQGRQRVSTAYQEAISAVDESETIFVEDQVIFGRKDSKVDVFLSHPQVSQKHTSIKRKGDVFLVYDLGSDTGTFVDGDRIQKPTELKQSGELAIGPYRYERHGEHLVACASVNSTELLCRELKQVVTDRFSGEQITILNEVSLVANPREFLVLLGPSGSGKSTLLNALAARTLATSGDVAINGQNLYANFESIKQSIAVIPQKDVLHDQLKLQTALNYTASLRLPPDHGRKETKQLIAELLKTVELTQRHSTPIHALSGGQIKRASVANEILSNPGLIFVDEATSGLDEYTDGELMGLFRRLAEDGRTIVCITHNLTNVEKFCHRVAILAPGGYLAFVGPPAEALEYFDIETLGDVYLRLKDKTGEQWKQQFRGTSAYSDMASHVETVVGRERPNLAQKGRPTGLQQIGIFVRQTRLLVQRGAEIQRADRNNLIMIGGQCILVGVLIALLFGNASLDNEEWVGQCLGQTRAILFLMSISAFWFGCNNAAKEVVKERSIYEREQAVGLNVGSYYCAKLILLAVVTTLQIGLLFAIVSFTTGLEGNELSYVISLWLTGLTGISLGLAVSSYSSSENVAVTAVPLVVIPQVILAGMIAEVSGFAEFIAACLVTCYWSFGSLNAVLPESLGASPVESLQNHSYLFSIAAVAIHFILLTILGLGRLLAVSRSWSLSTNDLERWMRATGTVLSKQSNVFSHGD